MNEFQGRLLNNKQRKINWTVSLKDQWGFRSFYEGKAKDTLPHLIVRAQSVYTWALFWLEDADFGKVSWIIHAFSTSRQNYYNSLSSGCSKNFLESHQLIQNVAPRLNWEREAIFLPYYFIFIVSQLNLESVSNLFTMQTGCFFLAQTRNKHLVTGLDWNWITSAT